MDISVSIQDASEEELKMQEMESEAAMERLIQEELEQQTDGDKETL